VSEPPGQWPPPPDRDANWPAPPDPSSGWPPPERASAGGPVASGLLRPRAMTVGDTLDGAFQVLRRSWPTGLIAILVLIGGLALLSTLLLAPMLTDLATFDPVVDDVGQVNAVAGEFAGRTGLIGLLSLVVVIAASIAVLWSVREAERGTRTSVGGAIGFGLRRAPGLALVLFVLYLGLLVTFLVGALVLAGIGSLGDAGVVLAVLLGVAVLVLVLPAWFGLVQVLPAAVVLEDRGAWNALGRAFQVVTRRFWRVVGVVWLLYVLVIVLGIGGGLLAAPFGNLSEGAYLAVLMVQQVVFGLASVPVIAGLGAMLLLDASARTEGADLTARADGFGPGGPGGG
jgi:hypothetical protein